MTTVAKLAANRQNARRSTGPRTPEGKAASSQNARRHGLLARDPVVPGEAEDAFTALRDRLYADLAPADDVEELLVDRIAGMAWRLARLTGIEAGLFADVSSGTLDRYGSDVVQGRKRLARAFVDAADSLTTLARYEQTLERALYKALHELERRQAARRGDYVPPPVAVDVTLDALVTPPDAEAAVGSFGEDPSGIPGSDYPTLDAHVTPAEATG